MQHKSCISAVPVQGQCRCSTTTEPAQKHCRTTTLPVQHQQYHCSTNAAPVQNQHQTRPAPASYHYKPAPGVTLGRGPRAWNGFGGADCLDQARQGSHIGPRWAPDRPQTGLLNTTLSGVRGSRPDVRRFRRNMAPRFRVLQSSAVAARQHTTAWLPRTRTERKTHGDIMAERHRINHIHEQTQETKSHT